MERTTVPLSSPLTDAILQEEKILHPAPSLGHEQRMEKGDDQRG